MYNPRYANCACHQPSVLSLLLEFPMCLAQCACPCPSPSSSPLDSKNETAPGALSLPCSLQWGYQSANSFLQFFFLLFPPFFLPFLWENWDAEFSINEIILFCSKQINQPVTATKQVSVVVNGRDKYSCLRTALHHISKIATETEERRNTCALWMTRKASQITASKAVQVKSPRVKQKGVFPSFFLGRAFNSCTHIQGWLTAASAAREECLWKIKGDKVQGTRDV